jgi:cytochrome P450
MLRFSKAGRFANLKPADYRYSFLKFGLGTKEVIGMSLAIVSGKLILIHVLQRFRLMKVEDKGR